MSTQYDAQEQWAFAAGCNPNDRFGKCVDCGNRYLRELSFYDDESLCPGCGDKRDICERCGKVETCNCNIPYPT